MKTAKILITTVCLVFASTNVLAASAKKSDQKETQEKMVRYMQVVNHDLPLSVAVKLASAMLEQQAKHRIPVEIQMSIVRRESAYNQYALGEQGELGFFQIMLNKHTQKVFKMMKSKEITTQNIYDPHTQTTVAMTVLNDCLIKKHRDMNRALACYNGAMHPGAYSEAVLEKAKAIKRLLAKP